eukprot:10027166-Karenia_brevis.AAC.2
MAESLNAARQAGISLIRYQHLAVEFSLRQLQYKSHIKELLQIHAGHSPRPFLHKTLHRDIVCPHM